MNTLELKTQHNGTEITYVEKTNLWTFELRGRERKAESLVKAKEIIDTPEREKKPAFTRVKAYTERSYDGSGFQTVEVTSIADTQHWQATEYWISTGKGNRQRMACFSLFPVNGKNDALIAKVKIVDTQLEALKKERDALIKQLTEMPSQK